MKILEKYQIGTKSLISTLVPCKISVRTMKKHLTLSGLLCSLQSNRNENNTHSIYLLPKATEKAREQQTCKWPEKGNKPLYKYRVRPQLVGL